MPGPLIIDSHLEFGDFIMIDLAQTIIGTQPILALFLAIGVGYLVGQINLGGFSLGVGAVLFVGLAIGAFAPKSSITGPIGLTGLIMFLYGIGILYGRQFFEGMTGVIGIKYNLLALVACVAGLIVALLLGQAYGIKIGHTLGLYAGSMTSTATLQAALDVIGNKDPSIGYSIAYPFGVIGPILCIYFMTRHVQPSFPPKAQQFHMAEVTLASHFKGRRLDDISADLPDGVQVTMVRKAHQNIVPAADIVLGTGDGLMLVADRKDALDEAATRLGKLEPGRIIKDRSALDYIRVFVGKANVVGVLLGQVGDAGRLSDPSPACPALRHGHRSFIGFITRGIRRSGWRADAAGFAVDDIRKGTSATTVKATAEFSYVALGLTEMVMGVLLGLIPIPIPGVGTVTLGIGGGPLIVALIVGKLALCTGPLLWVMLRFRRTSSCAISAWRCSSHRLASMPDNRSSAPWPKAALRCCSSAWRFC